MEGYSEFALSDEEKARGLILACRAVPSDESEVAWLEEDDLIVHPRRAPRLQGRRRSTMPRTTSSASGSAIVSGGPFDFSAGQFASVTFEGCPPRDYSMANVPGDPILEFHVRRTAGGATSAHVAREAEGRRQRAGRGPVRRLLPAREPSRSDHRGRRRLGHGADQVDRRARAAEGPAAAHLLLFRRPQRARPLPARPLRRARREAQEPALHSGAERRRRHRAGAAAWCTRRSRRLRRGRRLQGLSRRPAGHGRGRDACCSSSAACGASISMPTPSTRRPKWRAPARKRERIYERACWKGASASSPAPAAASAAPSPSRWSPRARRSSWPTTAPRSRATTAIPTWRATVSERRLGKKALAFTESVASPGVARQLVDLAMKNFGGIDIVVNNAAILRDAFVFRADPRDWDAVIRTNLSAAFYLINAASGVMREQGKSGRGGKDGYDWGRIVNIVSSAGLYGNLGQAAYASAKAGLFGLTRVTAMDLARGADHRQRRGAVRAHPRHRHHPARQRRAEDLQGARAQDRRAPCRQPGDGAVLAGRQGRSPASCWACAAARSSCSASRARSSAARGSMTPEHARRRADRQSSAAVHRPDHRSRSLQHRTPRLRRPTPSVIVVKTVEELHLRTAG